MKESDRPTLKQIRSAASILFGESIFDSNIKGNGSRGDTSVIRKRQICHYVAHKLFKYSQGDVGAEFGGKDHATVLHSAKVIEREIDTYPEINIGVRRLYNMCRQKDQVDDVRHILISILRMKDVSPNAKIQVNRVMKILKSFENEII